MGGLTEAFVRSAWSNPDDMRVLVDSLLEDGIIEIEDVSDLFLLTKNGRLWSDRGLRAHALHLLEFEARRQILKYLKLIPERKFNTTVGFKAYPIWLPNATKPEAISIFSPPAPDIDISDECRAYVFPILNGRMGKLRCNLGPPVPMCLEYDTLIPSGFSFLNPIFARIKKNETTYDQVIEWITAARDFSSTNITDGRVKE